MVVDQLGEAVKKKASGPPCRWLGFRLISFRLWGGVDANDARIGRRDWRECCCCQRLIASHMADRSRRKYSKLARHSQSTVWNEREESEDSKKGEE